MIRFGTGGWREVIGDQFTKANVQWIAAAVAQKMKNEGADARGIVIGYDRRFLSVEAAEWICEVFAGCGIVSRLIRMEAPTPLVMYCVQYFGCDYGLIVTASHNPAIYNGIKIFTAGGCDASEQVTKQIEAFVAQCEKEEIRTVPLKKATADGLVLEVNPQNEYVDSIIRMIDMDAIRSRNLKIVLDPMYGVSRTSLQMILLTARCTLDVIHERHDTLFGGRMPAPTEDTLRSLMAYVVENKCDIGIATDGDADRVGIVDNRGKFLHPNKILVLLYYYLLTYKHWKGPVVRNLATTHLLDKIAEKHGEKCYETPVGFKHISAKMIDTGAIIGGESSGGLTVKGHIQGKDGIYASALLVEMIAVTGRGLSEIYDEIAAEFGGSHMEERAYEFSNEKKTEIYQLLMVERALPAFREPVNRVSYLDGCKIYFENGGWAIARFSGTEPLLRVFCEMPDRFLAREICNDIERFLGL